MDAAAQEGKNSVEAALEGPQGEHASPKTKKAFVHQAETVCRLNMHAHVHQNSDFH